MTLSSKEEFLESPYGDAQGNCHECGVATVLYEDEGHYLCGDCINHRIFDHQNGEWVF